MTTKNKKHEITINISSPTKIASSITRPVYAPIKVASIRPMKSLIKNQSLKPKDFVLRSNTVIPVA